MTGTSEQGDHKRCFQTIGGKPVSVIQGKQANRAITSVVSRATLLYTFLAS
jgi:hypothetical protein